VTSGGSTAATGPTAASRMIVAPAPEATSRPSTVRRGNNPGSEDTRCISSPSGGDRGVRRQKPYPVHRRPAEQLEPQWGELLSRSPIAEVFCDISRAIAGMRTGTRHIGRCCAFSPYSSGGPGTQMRVGRFGTTARHRPAGRGQRSPGSLRRPVRYVAARPRADASDVCRFR